MYGISVNKKMAAKFLAICISMLWLCGCDVLDDDVAPENKDIRISGNELYVLPDGSGFINLNALVQSQQSVRLDVTTQPAKGTLSEISKGMLHYRPDQNFIKGKDIFQLSVFSADNKLLKKDTVVIIVENDTTKLPCGIYPKNDYVFDVKGEMAINAMINDVLCGDSAQYRLEIYEPDPSAPPYAGTAMVVDNYILYKPGNGFNGTDKIVYRIVNKNDASKVGFGIVYIEKAPSCTFTLRDDHYRFRYDTLTSDTLHLDVLLNDQLCSLPLSSYGFEITEFGDEGTAFRSNIAPIGYRLPSNVTRTFTDSVAYSMCLGQQCKSAKVYITIDH
jgi:hypothetical protein